MKTKLRFRKIASIVTRYGIKAILCSREGIDTTYSDWMEVLPKMIKILQKETSENTLEQHANIPFLSLLTELLKVLKKTV